MLPDLGRFKQVNGFTDATTLYIDGLYELTDDGTDETHTHYIRAHGATVAIYTSTSTGAQSTRLVHHDSLGVADSPAKQ